MSDRWLEAFRQNPQVAVSDIFTGRAGVGSDMRLDVPELLYQWFPPDLVEDRACLDDALISWLLDMRDGYASLVRRIGFPVYGKRVGDALIALQLLDLPPAKEVIRADLDAWLRWLSPLRLASERDPALECYRLLTHGQLDAGHTAMWLRLAADGRPEYLTVALAGLQLLPNDSNARKNQILMLRALLRHAATIHHDVNAARRFFNRRFAALRGRFPRSLEHWNRILNEALDGFLDPSETQVATDLVRDLREKLPANVQKSPSRQSRGETPAKEHEWRTLERDIVNQVQGSDTLARRLFDILERNHDYASATGDSYAFARTLSNLGSKLLVRHRLDEDDLTRFGVMIERALVWEPANPYCWTLWAKWFQVQGQKEAQEAVLREMLRMFPSNVTAQVELARLLIVQGAACWDEAEQYLRRTIDRDPENGHAHAVMARLLALRGQPDDAKKTLADFLDQHPDNQEARRLLNGIQAGMHINTAAPFEDSPSDWPQVQIGSDYSPTTVTNGALQEILRRGRLAGEFGRAVVVGHTNAVQTIKQESLRGDALAGFYSQWLKLEGTPTCPPHAWAWDACQHWQQSAADDWAELEKRFPEAAPETDFLRMLAQPDPSSGTLWQDRYCSGNGAAPRPVDTLMRDRRELLTADLGHREREDLACAVMACAAANAPEFAAT